MGGAQHTGKLVLDIPRSGQSSVVVPPEQAPVSRSDGAYIITGGLGGLGLFLAEKMASAGCGRIVLTSRSQPNDKVLETIDLIRAMGADIVVECGDIAAPGTAKRLVAAACATDFRCVASCTPRGRGRCDAAEHHRRTHRAGLGSEVYGVEPAQGSGCAAARLVLLVLLGGRVGGFARSGRIRRGQQLAGCLRQMAACPRPSGQRDRMGAWAEIGRATAVAEAADTAITPDEGAYAFQALLRHDRATPDTHRCQTHRGSPRSRSAAASPNGSVQGQSSADTSKLLNELHAMPQDEWPVRLRRLVSDQVNVILRRAIDPDRALSEYGLDSLGNLELRTHIKAETGVRVTSADITTIQGLAALLWRKADIFTNRLGTVLTSKCPLNPRYSSEGEEIVYRRRIGRRRPYYRQIG